MRRIGINALYLKPGEVGGTEIYLRGLLAGFAEIDKGGNQYIVFGNAETEAFTAPASNFIWERLPVRSSFRAGRILYEQSVLPWAARHVDVMLNPGFTAPLAGFANVTVFHDLQHVRHPEYFRWFDLPAWRLLLRASAMRSKRLIAVSEATRVDLQKYYGLESTVVPHGVDARFYTIGEARALEPSLLYVSTLHPHKNHVRLLRAFAAFHGRRPEFLLVLAGVRGFATPQVEAEIARLNLQKAVRVTGWISQESMYELYRTAAAAVYPSTFEGFGMPVLEAFASQVPLACSAIEPLTSLAAGHAVLFDPEDVDDLAGALERVIDNPPDTKLALEYSRRFTWAEAARRTLDVLLSV